MDNVTIMLIFACIVGVISLAVGFYGKYIRKKSD